MTALEMDTDFLNYEVAYLRRVKDGRVRCCGADWSSSVLADLEGQMVRVVARDSYNGRFMAIESMTFNYIGIAQRLP